MKGIVSVFFVLLLVLTGCTNKTDKTFKPLSPNPEYIIVIKKQTPDKVLGSAVIQGDQIKQIIDEINSSHKMITAKNCSPSVDSLDVVVHYANGLIDRTFTAL